MTPTVQLALAWSGVNGAKNHVVVPAERHPNLAPARLHGPSLHFPARPPVQTDFEISLDRAATVLAAVYSLQTDALATQLP